MPANPQSHPIIRIAATQAPERNKIVTAAEAVRLIRDGDTVATGGFVGVAFPEGIAVAIEQRFLASEEESGPASGKPSGLTLVYAAGQGDGKERGLNHLGHPGLIKRVDWRSLGPGAQAGSAGG